MPTGYKILFYSALAAAAVSVLLYIILRIKNASYSGREKSRKICGYIAAVLVCFAYSLYLFGPFASGKDAKLGPVYRFISSLIFFLMIIQAHDSGAEGERFFGKSFVKRVLLPLAAAVCAIFAALLAAALTAGLI